MLMHKEIIMPRKVKPTNARKPPAAAMEDPLSIAGIEATKEAPPIKVQIIIGSIVSSIIKVWQKFKPIVLK